VGLTAADTVFAVDRETYCNAARIAVGLEDTVTKRILLPNGTTATATVT
jgi:hypothetical protein